MHWPKTFVKITNTCFKKDKALKYTFEIVRYALMCLRRIIILKMTDAKRK